MFFQGSEKTQLCKGVRRWAKVNARPGSGVGGRVRWECVAAGWLGACRDCGEPSFLGRAWRCIQSGNRWFSRGVTISYDWLVAGALAGGGGRRCHSLPGASIDCILSDQLNRVSRTPAVPVKNFLRLFFSARGGGFSSENRRFISILPRPAVGFLFGGPRPRPSSRDDGELFRAKSFDVSAP